MLEPKTLFHPEAFQGTGKRAPYFEGWYYRVEAPCGRSFALIPGISLTRDDSHCFIQVLDSSGHQTEYHRFPAGEFVASRERLDVWIAENHFTLSGFETDVVRARCRFLNPVYFPQSPVCPGIMGPFSFVPGLECRHGVVLMAGGVSGSIQAGDETVRLDGGNAYVEKDWGSSFPEPYLWMQAGNFRHGRASFMLSVASVPFCGRKFTGTIGFLYWKGKTRLFATYAGDSLRELRTDGKQVLAVIKSPVHSLYVKARIGDTGRLKAPSEGKMCRTAKECVNGCLELGLKDLKGQWIFMDGSDSACIEMGGDPLKLKR